MRARRGIKHNLLPLLEGLAREMGAAPPDAPYGVPHALDSLKQAMQNLAEVLLEPPLDWWSWMT